MFPDNLMQACFQSVATAYKEKIIERNITNTSVDPEIWNITKEIKMERTLVYTGGTNVMGK